MFSRPNAAFVFFGALRAVDSVADVVGEAAPAGSARRDDADPAFAGSEDDAAAPIVENLGLVLVHTGNRKLAVGLGSRLPGVLQLLQPQLLSSTAGTPRALVVRSCQACNTPRMLLAKTSRQ